MITSQQQLTLLTLIRITLTLIIIRFFEHEISILEWFLNKDHVTLKKIQLCITRINNILKYIQIENSYFNCNINSQHFNVFTVFFLDQINAYFSILWMVIMRIILLVFGHSVVVKYWTKNNNHFDVSVKV